MRLARLGGQRHADGADELPPPFPLSSAAHWALCRSHSRPACARTDRQCECASARKPLSEHQSYAAFCCRDVTISWLKVHASTLRKPGTEHCQENKSLIHILLSIASKPCNVSLHSKAHLNILDGQLDSVLIIDALLCRADTALVVSVRFSSVFDPG